MEKKKNITIAYGSMLWTYWMGFAVLSAFASVYLLDSGLSNSAIGVVLSGGALSAAVLQPFVGGVIDRSKTIGNKQVIALFSVATTVFCGLLCFVPRGEAIAIGVMYAVAYIMLQLSQPFTNALGMECINSGYYISFGPARAVGSLGYAATAYVLGVLTVTVGMKSIPMAGVLSFFLISVTVLFFIPSLKMGGGVHEQELSHVKNSPIDFVKKYKMFIVMLVGLICIYYTHTIINTYALQILMTKGGGSSEVGLGAAIAAGLEIVPMIGFPFISKRFKMRNLIRIASIFFTIKIFATLLVPGIASYMAIQLLQIGGWGTLAVSIVYYVNEVVNLEDASQGQAYAGVSMTMGTVVATLVGGRMLDVLGVNMTLVIGTVVGIIGTLIVFFSTSDKAIQSMNKL